MMWLARSRVDGNCAKCGEEYKKHSVVGIISLNTSHGNVRLFYHPDPCWLAVLMSAFNAEPKQDKYSPEQKDEIKRIKHHWSQLVYREKQLRRKYTGDKLVKSLNLIEHSRNELRLRIATLGETPKGWEE